jgi:hypothetical protein
VDWRNSQGTKKERKTSKENYKLERKYDEEREASLKRQGE